ncbi:MAG: hypothetical protein HY426_04000 [Candidatus Levybacteria bacterium]|nr:hypothetical protein [Candidatus Levybacteria bacterium]
MKRFFQFTILLAAFLFFLAPKAHAYLEVEYRFFSNNRANINWEVGFRVIGNFDRRVSQWTYSGVYQRWVTTTSCITGVQCKIGTVQGVTRANGRPLDPKYGMQWGTGCIDPKISLGDSKQRPDSTWYYTSNNVNLTFSRSNLDNLGVPAYTYNYLDDIQWFEDNGGKNIPFPSGFGFNCPEKPAPKYEIDGTVFNDSNENGNRDGGEGGVNGVQVQKWGDYYESIGTGNGGYFRFYNLPSRNDYRVAVNAPNGWHRTNDGDRGGLSLPPNRSINFGIARNCQPNNSCNPGQCGGGIPNGCGGTKNCGDCLNNNTCVSNSCEPRYGCNSNGQCVKVKNGPYVGSNCGGNCQPPARPDLDITAFNFPGGAVCTANNTTDATVTIRNIGNAAVTNDFNVRVEAKRDGSAANQTWRVTQNVSPGEKISHTFNNVPRPNVGNHTASATVDSGGNVNESNEGNNSAFSDYTVSACTPDLDITEFNFPGGDESLTSDAKVTIRNRGNRTITDDFSVRVDNKINRSGQYQIWRVTQTLSPGQTIPHTFSNIPRPIPGSYRALATVDSRIPDEVSESNEGNNTAEDPYTTWASPYNPIQGTVYVDSDGDGVVSGGDGRYTKRGTLTTSPGGRTDEPSPTNGTYSILNNPNGTYSVTLSNLAIGYRVISANPRTNVVVSGAPASGVNFLVRAPAVIPNTISGTVYIDSNSNRTIDGGDHLYTTDEGADAPIRVRARHNATGTITDDTNLTSSSMYSIDVAGTNTGVYSITVANLISGYSVVDGANAPYPRNINVAGDRSGENFLISATLPPATYSITGGVFIDNNGNGLRESTDGNGRKDAGEPYTNGNIRIGGTDYSSGGSGFSATGFADGSTQTVTYTNPPPGYNVTYPGSNPPSVGVTVGGACADGGGDSGCNNGNIENLNFGIAPIIADPWIQSIGGDLRYDRINFINIVPDGATCSNTTRPYVSSNSVVNNNLSSGIVFSGTGPQFAQSGTQNSKAAPNGWLLTGNAFSPARSGTIKTSYTYVKAAIDKGRVTTSPMFGGACTQGSGPNCNLRGGLTHGAYIQSGSVTLQGGGTYSFPAAQDYVFLIDGNLRIETNIDVPTDSTAIFIVSGNITVASNVTQIEGIYSANRTFTFDGGTNNPLIIEGNIIANAGLSSGNILNNRDLEVANANCPAVRVVGRPDFILNSPELIRYPNSLIQEVAPQGGN